MLSEQTAPVAVLASSQTDVDYNKSHQQLAVSVDTERSYVEDPFNDLVVVINQNGRLDNEVAMRQPLRLQRSTAVYEHQPALIFDAETNIAVSKS